MTEKDPADKRSKLGDHQRGRIQANLKTSVVLVRAKLLGLSMPKRSASVSRMQQEKRLVRIFGYRVD
jgi:hypothetical protein